MCGSADSNGFLYRQARELSWQILLKHQIDQLPVDLTFICRREAILLKSYAEFEQLSRALHLQSLQQQSDGISIRFENHYVILYNDRMPQPRQRYTIAHELGHCLLNHLDNSAGATTADEKGYQAERFAIQLLAPACVLWGLQVKNADEIMALCNISHTAAVIRMERMAMLYRRNQRMQEETGHSCFLSASLEQKVFQQFLPYISKMKAQSFESD